MKTYTKPEIKVNKFNNKDSILLTSNATAQTTLTDYTSSTAWSQMK